MGAVVRSATRLCPSLHCGQAQLCKSSLSWGQTIAQLWGHCRQYSYGREVLQFRQYRATQVRRRLDDVKGQSSNAAENLRAVLRELIPARNVTPEHMGQLPPVPVRSGSKLDDSALVQASERIISSELCESLQERVVSFLRQCATESPEVGYDALSRLRMNGYWIRRSHIRALLESSGISSHTTVADLNEAYCRMFKEFAARDWPLEGLKLLQMMRADKLVPTPVMVEELIRMTIRLAARHKYARAGTPDDLLLPVLELLNGTRILVSAKMMKDIRLYALDVLKHRHQATAELMPYYQYAVARHVPHWLDARRRIQRVIDTLNPPLTGTELASLYDNMLLSELCLSLEHAQANELLSQMVAEGDFPYETAWGVWGRMIGAVAVQGDIPNALLLLQQSLETHQKVKSGIRPKAIEEAMPVVLTASIDQGLYDVGPILLHMAQPHTMIADEVWMAYFKGLVRLSSTRACDFHKLLKSVFSAPNPSDACRFNIPFGQRAHLTLTSALNDRPFFLLVWTAMLRKDLASAIDMFLESASRRDIFAATNDEGRSTRHLKKEYGFLLNDMSQLAYESNNLWAGRAIMKWAGELQCALDPQATANVFCIFSSNGRGLDHDPGLQLSWDYAARTPIRLGKLISSLACNGYADREMAELASTLYRRIAESRSHDRSGGDREQFNFDQALSVALYETYQVKVKTRLDHANGYEGLCRELIALYDSLRSVWPLASAQAPGSSLADVEQSAQRTAPATFPLEDKSNSINLSLGDFLAEHKGIDLLPLGTVEAEASVETRQDLQSTSTLIELLGKCKRPDIALAYYKRAAHRWPDSINLGMSIIKAFASTGEYDAVLALRHTMAFPPAELDPDYAATLIYAYAQKGYWFHGMCLSHQFDRKGLLPDSAIFTIVSKAYGKLEKELWGAEKWPIYKRYGGWMHRVMATRGFLDERGLAALATRRYKSWDLKAIMSMHKWVKLLELHHTTEYLSTFIAGVAGALHAESFGRRMTVSYGDEAFNEGEWSYRGRTREHMENIRFMAQVTPESEKRAIFNRGHLRRVITEHDMRNGIESLIERFDRNPLNYTQSQADYLLKRAQLMQQYTSQTDDRGKLVCIRSPVYLLRPGYETEVISEAEMAFDMLRQRLPERNNGNPLERRMEPSFRDFFKMMELYAKTGLANKAENAMSQSLQLWDQLSIYKVRANTAMRLLYITALVRDNRMEEASVVLDSIRVSAGFCELRRPEPGILAMRAYAAARDVENVWKVFSILQENQLENWEVVTREFEEILQVAEGRLEPKPAAKTDEELLETIRLTIERKRETREGNFRKSKWRRVRRDKREAGAESEWSVDSGNSRPDQNSIDKAYMYT